MGKACQLNSLLNAQGFRLLFHHCLARAFGFFSNRNLVRSNVSAFSSLDLFNSFVAHKVFWQDCWLYCLQYLTQTLVKKKNAYCFVFKNKSFSSEKIYLIVRFSGTYCTNHLIESWNSKKKTLNIEHVLGGGVVHSMKVTKQISSSACMFEKSFGYNSTDLWVDFGCRAYFEVCLLINGKFQEINQIFSVIWHCLLVKYTNGNVNKI